MTQCRVTALEKDTAIFFVLFLVLGHLVSSELPNITSLDSV